MRRVPSFLPSTIFVYTSPDRTMLVGGMRTGNDVRDVPVTVPTQMKFVLYSSPAIINGLLMTEVLVPDQKEAQRFFFGYHCSVCNEVFLVSSRVQQEYQVVLEMGHPCDPSDLRRAVRNARNLGRSDNEHIVEGFGGKWWYEDRSKYLLDPLVNDAVYSREQVNHMLARGDISPARADELLHMRYDSRDRKIDHEK